VFNIFFGDFEKAICVAPAAFSHEKVSLPMLVVLHKVRFEIHSIFQQLLKDGVSE